MGRVDLEALVVRFFKDLLKRTPLYRLVLWRALRRERIEIDRYLETQAVKYRAIREYARDHGLRTLVETGTYRGDAIAACRECFDRVYSIELAEDLAARARERFSADPDIHLIVGDSALRLPQVLQEVGAPALFWLDGHYSGGATARAEIDTPVVAELRAILHHPVKGHVLLIDDAREFVGADGYPTLSDVEAMVHAADPNARYEVRDDIIRVIMSA